ncbi:MAG: hypothetical protein F6J87_06000 [Spirulina sp. SIO3F2]|nr:hypothetical protein [Spirulina sp. SIO3F2]
MLKQKPHQYHGTYQRRTRLSLEVSERELLGYSNTAQGSVRLTPHTPMPAALGAIGRSPQQCPIVEAQGDVAVKIATLAHQCTLPQPAIAIDPLAQLHSRNIRQTLTRRLKAACERGDQALVSLLQQEAAQFA